MTAPSVTSTGTMPAATAASPTPSTVTGVTADQVLYQAFVGLQNGPATDQTSFNSLGLTPQDAAFANSLNYSDPLGLTNAVNAFASIGNLLPDTVSGQSGSFENYKANALGSLTPDAALGLVNQIAGPVLQQYGLNTAGSTASSQSSAFGNYKANALSGMTPQDALNLVNQIAAPVLQQYPQA